MKKIILIFFVSVFLSGVTVPIQAEEYENSNLYYAESVLEMLEIIDDSVKDDMNADISRAQFVTIVARILGISNYAVNTTRYFTDVPMNHLALNSINMLVEKGIIVQNEDKLFRPEDTLTAYEAGIILLKIGGYGKMADGLGENAWDMLIAENELTDGMQSYSKMTVGDAYIMIYNALMMGMCQMTGITASGNVTVETDKNKTLLSEYFDIYHINGRITAVEDISMSGISAGKDQAVIGDEIFETGEVDMYEYFGMTADVFYYNKGKNEPNVIKLVLVKDNYNKVEEINLEDIEDIGNDLTISYEIDEKIRRIDVLRNSVIVYNEELYEGNLSALKEEKNGTLKLIAPKNSKGYDIVIAEVYKNEIISYIDNTNLAIYMKNGEAIRLLDYSDNELILAEDDGTPVTSEVLRKDDLLSIYRSGNKIKIYRNNTTVSGMITKTDFQENLIYVDNDEYKIDENFLLTDKDSFQAGESYVFCLDISGKIAALKKFNTDSFLFGYLIKIARDDTSVDNSLILKIYNEQDEIVKLKCSEKVILDGISVKMEALNALLGENQLIRYRTKEDGTLREIDTKNYTAGRETEYTLRETIRRQTLLYNSANCFSPQRESYPTALLDDNTLIFCVPEELNGADKEDFSIVDRSAFSVWDSEELAAYKTDGNSPYEEVLVIYGSKSNEIVSKTPIMMVDSIKTELNQDDEIVEVLYAYRNGNQISYTCADGYSLTDAGVERGDIVRVGRNAQGYVNDYEMIFDCGTMTASDSTLFAEDYMSEHRVTSGRVITKNENVIKFSRAGNYIIDEAADLTYTSIMVYDTSGKTKCVRAGSADDIRDYESTKGNCSVVVGYTYIGRMDQLFVYNID